MARKRYSDEDILKLLREIELNLAAGNDVAKRVEPLADGERLTLKVIEDADHMFLDFCTEDAVELITNFIKPGS